MSVLGKPSLVKTDSFKQPPTPLTPTLLWNYSKSSSVLAGEGISKMRNNTRSELWTFNSPRSALLTISQHMRAYFLFLCVHNIARHAEAVHQVHFRWCAGCLVVAKPLAEGPMSLETVTLALIANTLHCIGLHFAHNYSNAGLVFH